MLEIYAHKFQLSPDFLENLRGLVFPWIYSYDVSSHEMIAHTDLSCFDLDKISHYKLISAWRTKLGSDKRELMLVLDEYPVMQRVLNGISISHSDLILIFLDRYNLRKERVSLENYVIKFQQNEKLCVLFSTLVTWGSETLERIFIVRRS